MKNQVREEPKIVSAAERQMQAWARSAEMHESLGSAGEASSAATHFGPFLTVSREHGAGGGAIAEMVAKKLGWEVLGRTLLDRVASRYQLSRPLLELVDETKASWAHDVLGTWIDPRVISHEKYITHLRHVVVAAAQCGRVVFVGRGAQFFLPATAGIAVRIVAPEAYRVAELAERYGCDEKQTRRRMKEADTGRRDFVARYFQRDIDDPHLYDLVINVVHHGPAAAAEMIFQLCSRLKTVRA
ncbi:MAG: cytidylate kinase-like family protein [Pirellulales bacterium]|nr:cytidylate kinase-like family protein [Pirellulales bacterium]